MDEAREYELSRQTPSTSQASSEPSLLNEGEIRILTFAELKELIESGKTDQIPNNKVISEALNVRIFATLLVSRSNVPLGRSTERINCLYQEETLGNCYEQQLLKCN